MNRKAQFYILAAVMLLAITFGLFAAMKTFGPPDRTFGLLAENYIKEAPFAANTNNLEDFTIKFYDFAVSKEPNFEMVYLYTSQGNISAFSLVKSTIFINEYNLSFNESVAFGRQDAATVSIGNQQYDINTSAMGIKAVFISEKEGTINVRTG